MPLHAADAPQRGDRVLLFTMHWLRQILAGEKTMEVRGCRTGLGGLWLACGDQIYAWAEVETVSQAPFSFFLCCPSPYSFQFVLFSAPGLFPGRLHSLFFGTSRPGHQAALQKNLSVEAEGGSRPCTPSCSTFSAGANLLGYLYTARATAHVWDEATAFGRVGFLTQSARFVISGPEGKHSGASLLVAWSEPLPDQLTGHFLVPSRSVFACYHAMGLPLSCAIDLSTVAEAFPSHVRLTSRLWPGP